jgi:carbonic anhydrase
MRLFEAIIQANHRALSGDHSAGLRPADYEESLPIAALTCIDSRLNPLLPNVLGIPEDQFIWARNAGNIVTGPLSSTLRSLALACAVKGAREIALIGHTDCQVSQCTAFTLIERLRAIGIERNLLPENLNEFFGMFGSERQNVIKGAEHIRNSPLISPQVPVHGLVVDTHTGKLEWLVNGYETINTSAGAIQRFLQSADKAVDAFKSLADFQLNKLNMPEMKIGEIVSQFESWTRPAPGPASDLPLPGAPPPEPPQNSPPRLPLPPRVKPKLSFKKPNS